VPTRIFIIPVFSINRIFQSQLAQLLVNAGGVAAMVDFIGENKGNVRLPGVMMLGYVGAHTENLAMAVIVSKVNVELSEVTTRQVVLQTL
jgi:hypothetical protein